MAVKTDYNLNKDKKRGTYIFTLYWNQDRKKVRKKFGVRLNIGSTV